MVDLAILVLRVCLGVVFIAHGLQAAFGMFGGPGVKGFADMLSGLGFKPALFWSYIGAYTELIGGLMLMLGIFTRVATILIFHREEHISENDVIDDASLENQITEHSENNELENGKDNNREEISI